MGNLLKHIYISNMRFTIVIAALVALASAEQMDLEKDIAKKPAHQAKQKQVK